MANIASQGTTTRRALLSGGLVAAAAVLPLSVAAAALPKPASAPALLPEHKAIVVEIRRRSAVLNAAVTHEMSHEFRMINGRECPPYKRACKASAAAEGKLARLTQRVLDRSVQSWADVHVLAELVAAWVPQTASHPELKLANGLCPHGQKAVEALFMATMLMGRSMEAAS